MAIPSEERTLPLITYGLMLATVVTGISGIVALVLAYVSRGEASEELQSHYDFIIRTFWIAFIINIVAFVLMFTIILAPVSMLTFLAVAVWALVRMIIGIVKLSNGEVIGDPKTNMLP